MAEAATDIVRVEVLDGRAAYWRNATNEIIDADLEPEDRDFLLTIHRLRVIEVFLGDFNPDYCSQCDSLNGG
jgi:hypothetical protein